MMMVTTAPGMPNGERNGRSILGWLRRSRMKLDRLRDVAQHRTEHGHVEQHRADDVVTQLRLAEPPPPLANQITSMTSEAHAASR